MELLKTLNASEILAQVFSFLLLLFLLKHFVWKKILEVMERRREKIAGEFEMIKDAKAQVAAVRADYEAKLATIQEYARARIDEAVEEGKKINAQIRKKAYEDAQNIITDARKQISYEISEAQERLKDQIVDIALGAAEAVIQEKFNGDTDRRIVEEFIEGVEKER